MMNIAQQLIDAGLPVECITTLDDESGVVLLHPSDRNDADRATAQAIADAAWLSHRKAAALAVAQAEYVAAGETGVDIDASDLVSVGRAVRMRYVPEALANYQEVATLITLAGAALPGVVLWDADGAELTLTVADAGALLARYAAAAAQSKVAYMQRQAAINAAESIAALEAL